MPRASAYSDIKVIGPKGKMIGTVTRVLFHPSEQRAVGLEMRPRPVGYVVERKPQYYALDALEVGEESARLLKVKAPSGEAAARRLGIDWDETVIWRHQDVKTRSGVEMGVVSDVVLDDSGTIVRIEVSGGATADVAVGRHTVGAKDIIGFDGKVVRVKDVADEAPTSGGVAAHAGRGAAVAKHVAGKATVATLTTGVKAARAARGSKTGKRVAKGWRSFSDAFKEGLHGDDEKS